MPAGPVSLSPRRRRWTRVETVAWIAYRQLDAVARAATPAPKRRKRKGATIDPLTRLVVIASLRRPFQITKRHNPAARVAAADRLLRCLERRGLLAADKNGAFSSLAVRRLIRSKEGRRLGQQKRPYGDNAKVIKLGWYFITTPPKGSAPLKKAHEWCISNGLPVRYERYTKLRQEALAWAARELTARERSHISIAHAMKASQEEFANARENLKLWQALTEE